MTAEGKKKKSKQQTDKMANEALALHLSLVGILDANITSSLTSTWLFL